MKLDEKQRAWLVAKWACYARPVELLKEFEDTFGARIPPNQARDYDLSGILTEADAKAKGRGKWFNLFRQCRAEFEAAVVDIPIASSAFRIKKLDEMFDQAFIKRNFKTAAQLLEQAAKETGGTYAGKRVIEGKVEHSHTHEEVPEDIKRATMAHRIREAIAEALSQEALPPAGSPLIQ